MLLNEFPEWKQNALNYWNNKIYTTPNMFYSKTITGASTSGYSGTPVYSNANDMYAVVTNGINNIENALNSYKANGSLFVKYKQSLLTIYSYVNMKYISIPNNSPEILYVQIDASLFDMMSYTLPDYTTLFTSGFTTLYGYEAGIDEFGWNNTQLLQNKLWYAGTVLSSASSGDLFVNDTGYVVDNGTSAVSTYINGSAARDITDLDNMAIAVQNSFLDNILYRVFAQPKYTVKDIHIKDYMLNNLGYNNLMNAFGWSVRGLNAP